MKKLLLSAIAWCMIILCATGCTTKMAPTCADKSTVDSVVKVIDGRMFAQDLITYDYKISDIRTTKVDKDTGAYSCAAYLEQNMTIKEAGGDKAKDDLRMIVRHWRGILDTENHGIIVKKIEYMSELTSENKHYVSVSIPE